MGKPHNVKSEKREVDHLRRLWATRRATAKQIHRCMELDRKLKHGQGKS